MKAYVIGIDYGTDSVRAILVDARSGEELASSVFRYPRWSRGLYCSPLRNQFRQHPLDYIEGLEAVVRDILVQQPGSRNHIKAVAFDTTGSTPCLTDKKGVPLALYPQYSENPDAMFVLWKDHTAEKEAEEINRLAERQETDYRIYSGKYYSSEWLWSKALHVIRHDPALRKDAYAMIEVCDWLPAMVTGTDSVAKIKQSRCSAGHKALWAADWGGFPPAEFFSRLDPLLAEFAGHIDSETYTCDQPAGYLSEEWTARLGLSTGVLVGIGNTDAHAGAVGAGVKYGTLVQAVGTSSCNMTVMPAGKISGKPIEGISGQVDGSIIPGMVGFEAGMSAFGDVYAWFGKMIGSAFEMLTGDSSVLDEDTKKRLTEEISEKVIPTLTRQAEHLPITENGLSATDWFNGRRNPFINYRLKATITGLTLASTAPGIFQALVEATVFGTKAIIDHLVDNGVVIDEIIAVGGIPRKSPYIMQVMADVLNVPVKVSSCEHSCALGSAMFAATVAGIFPKVEDARNALKRNIEKVYSPDARKNGVYNKRYLRYQEIGQFSENLELENVI